jgi:hypothetical protein
VSIVTVMLECPSRPMFARGVRALSDEQRRARMAEVVESEAFAEPGGIDSRAEPPRHEPGSARPVRRWRGEDEIRGRGTGGVSPPVSLLAEWVLDHFGRVREVRVGSSGPSCFKSGGNPLPLRAAFGSSGPFPGLAPGLFPSGVGKKTGSCEGLVTPGRKGLPPLPKPLVTGRAAG